MRLAAQIPLEAIQFSPQEQSQILHNLQNNQTMLQMESTTPSPTDRSPETTIPFQQKIIPPQPYVDTRGMVNYRGRWYDPAHVLDSDFLESEGIRANRLAARLG